MQKLRIAFKRTESPVVYCALTAGTGTRNEPAEYNGLAHFTEHMIFKGTSKRGSLSINNCLESEGGELNAYTTKEETVLQATVLKEDMSKAINLVLELVFDSVFPLEQLRKEREVVYDEIISYKDSPDESVCDEFESLFFKGHPLALPILGKKETLKKITPAILKEYLTKNFTPKNICLSVVGNSSEKEIGKIVNKALLKYLKKEEVLLEFINESDNAENACINVADEPAELIEGEKFKTIVHKRNHQVHCVMGCSAYSWKKKKRLHLALLTNMLGGPSSNSRLNMSLREKNGLVYNIEANYTPFADTGLFTIYFGCDKQYLEKCLALIEKELEILLEAPLKDATLKKIKKQFIGQLSVSLDNVESQALSMGKSVMVYNRIASFNEIKSYVENITAEELFFVAKEIFPKNRFSRLIYQ